MLTPTQVYSALLVMFGLAHATALVAQVGTTGALTTTTNTAVSTATATTTTPMTAGYTQSPVIEWDISMFQFDQQPGAITADLYSNSSGKVWFSTRQGNPRVYMFQPPQNFKYGSAQWTSWPLDQIALGPTGGLKRIRGSYDQRFVFVRTPIAIQKIDTVNDLSTTYCDDAVPTNQSSTCSSFSPVSDVAADNQNHVYYTFSGDLQRLDASADSCAVKPCASVAVTRWNLNTSAQGGISYAGICQTGGTTNPCLSGVAVHPKYQNLVYVAEPQNNTIAEIDTTAQGCSCPTPQNVRRWDLGKVGALQPRQINFDQDGVLWIVAGGFNSTLGVQTDRVFLVSLDPRKSVMTAYQIPPGTLQDTFGVAPDSGMIGYTANDADGGTTGDSLPEHKVAMLIPKGQETYVCPTPGWADILRTTIAPICNLAPRTGGSAPSNSRQVVTRITPEASGNGTFIEGFINRNAPSEPSTQKTSYVPLGIAPAFRKAVGTFFYAVGQPDLVDASGNPTVNRIGFIRLPRKGFKAKHEREDKDCSDDGSGQDDEDHDGVPDRYKTKDSKSKMDRQNDSLAPGQSTDYNMTTGSSTMAIVATIQADNALEPVSVQIIDPNGITLSLPIATPGLAVATAIPTAPGNYTIRVKNEGALPINPETQLITREPLSLP